METYKGEKWCGAVFTFGKNELAFWADLNSWAFIPTLIFNKEILPIYNDEDKTTNITYTLTLQCLCFRIDFDITIAKNID